MEKVEKKSLFFFSVFFPWLLHGKYWLHFTENQYTSSVRAIAQWQCFSPWYCFLRGLLKNVQPFFLFMVDWFLLFSDASLPQLELTSHAVGYQCVTRHRNSFFPTKKRLLGRKKTKPEQARTESKEAPKRPLSFCSSFFFVLCFFFFFSSFLRLLARKPDHSQPHAMRTRLVSVVPNSYFSGNVWFHTFVLGSYFSAMPPT